MGFKVDVSFLHYLTMGALGTRRVTDELRQLGFVPIELERYGTSNKIWETKIKRLRLPDVLCIRTGLRVEVRVKSNLEIKMSDTPNNPDRAWDAGMRGEDLIALVACHDENSRLVLAENTAYFTVAALQDAVATSRLGPPKSVSEGAERDRTWPAIVPKRPGTVLEVGTNKIVVMMEGDGKPARRQSYTMNGKSPYMVAGNRFQARSSILAGMPARMADLSTYQRRAYDPLADIRSTRVIDRFVAVKALRFREDLHTVAIRVLEACLDHELDERVVLEAAGSAAAIGSGRGYDTIRQILFEGARRDLSMEAILLLGEMRSNLARQMLVQVANNDIFRRDERRQAAVWCLGKAGVKSYRDLIPFIADEDESVSLHAISAFGSDTPRETIGVLIQLLQGGDARIAPAASEALRVIGSREVIEALVAAVREADSPNWLLAALGRLDPILVRGALQGDELLTRLEPMLLMAHGANWLSSEKARADLAFLLKQDL